MCAPNCHGPDPTGAGASLDAEQPQSGSGNDAKTNDVHNLARLPIESVGVRDMAAASISTLFRSHAKQSQDGFSDWGAPSPRPRKHAVGRDSARSLRVTSTAPCVEGLDHRAHDGLHVLGRFTGVAEVAVYYEKSQPMDDAPPPEDLCIRN